MYCEGDVPLLFTENETNNERIFGTPMPVPIVKDGINNYVVYGKQDAVNPEHSGNESLRPTISMTVEGGKTATIRLRLQRSGACCRCGDPFKQLC